MTATESFAEQLKKATWSDHEDAEHTAFLEALMGGRVSREGYAEMVAQHYFAYVALEEAGRALADDPVAGPFVSPELERLPALEADLEELYGKDWRDKITPSKPTLTYVARINQIADWPGGFIAHHYTRYLGDLSGGQVIRKVAERTYQFGAAAGVRFYLFPGIPDLKAFKVDYRDRLNALNPDEVEARRIIGETVLAYQLNTEVIVEIGKRLPEYLVA
ncbi:biliverdin-producing heme oxygenase [Microtetraspora sp. NBRC 16547]|uniref:biliverdin-producing heme oxygenase n=1 Tax=Microtetraspora sp. NBRC 16547 TaxID=3030993 RepID=UPI0024A53999|nr:biliverdin-producing heme oxygenase [Microtetraspora sp. NBRC 16547]GLX02565.1 biliverdin-producing heme oxygenase [Microtetraspora sp. NBRC 16547]